MGRYRVMARWPLKLPVFCYCAIKECSLVLGKYAPDLCIGGSVLCLRGMAALVC